MKPEDKPQNGIAGLKHWRFDLLSGLQVALVSLPLSLGIAIASGAPPVTGLVSAIIAGLIFPFLGGAYVTISGPAAGLAPALLAGMLTLGGGDLSEGYPLILVAIFITGVIMIILAQLRAGKLVAMYLPVTVVEAMLAAIGLMIIIKQVPALLGDLESKAKPMLESIMALPESLFRIDPSVIVISAISLFLIFFLNRTRHEWMRRIPAPLTVCAIGIGLGYLFNLDPAYLITMPENLLDDGITLPAFGDVLARSELWVAVVVIVITLTLIDSIESLATISAVDKIDPYRRKSEPNTTLRAMGVSNILSSMAGGLTIIPGGIKSTTNIAAGGRTLWANFANAMFLLVFLFFAAALIGRIPLAAIGAVIVYVGWRLCQPMVFIKTNKIGLDHIIVFVVTIVGILATDLLIGIIIGVVTQLILNCYLLTPSMRMVIAGRITLREFLISVASVLATIFRSPVIQMRNGDDNGQNKSQLSLKSLTGFNLLMLDRAVNKIPADAGLKFILSESGRIIDRTTMEYLHQLQEDCLHGNRSFEIVGLDRFHPFRDHPFSTRMQDISYARERAAHDNREREMSELAQQTGFDFNPEIIATHDRHDFIYLRRGENRQERNTIAGELAGNRVRIFDYSHTSAPDYYVEHRHTLVVLQPLDHAVSGKLPDLAITPGHYLERYLIAEYSESDPGDIDPTFAGKYRVFASDPALVSSLLVSELTGLMVAHAGYYVEIRRGALLVFHPDKDVEPTDDIADLLEFADRILATLTAHLPRH